MEQYPKKPSLNYLNISKNTSKGSIQGLHQNQKLWGLAVEHEIIGVIIRIGLG